MTWMDRISARLARKSSRAGAAVAAVGLAPARWTPRRYDRLAEEGYRKNVVAYRCVREVARACASVPWLLYKGAQELDTHPLLDLLRRPNPRQSGPELIEAAIGHLLLSGNAYLEVVRPDGDTPRELYALRPDRMRIVPDVSGVPHAYRYEVEGRGVDWPVDPISGASDVLHLRDFHPLDDWYGLSPIEAAASAIDQHNAAAEHNAALLQNGARPSGALVFRSDPGPDGIRRVEEALLDRTQGPRQAGRPLVLGGDVDWKELGFSPKDMDFAELKAQAAREIAAAFGVPHLLVVSGEATYSNRADARLELWEHTVIPLLDRVSSALSSWLGPMFGDGLRLAHDLDEIPALAPRRRLKWQQIRQADFLTLNEKRQALGYAPVEGEDAETKNSEDYERIHGYSQPRLPRGQAGGGRWAPGPTSLLKPTPMRSFFDGPVGPMASDPECQREWAVARAMCKGPAPIGATRASRGSDYESCVRGIVSARCGGNPIKSAQNGPEAYDCGCGMPLSPQQRQALPGDIAECYDLFEAGRHGELIAWMSRLFADQPEDWHLRWRAAAFEALGDRAAAREDLLRLVDRADMRLRENPNSWHCWYERGLAHGSIGNHEAARADFTRVIDMKPDIYGPRVERARAMIHLGRFTEALEDVEIAKELNWSDEVPGFDLLRAECFLGLGDVAAAFRCLNSMPQKLDPDAEAFRQELLARCVPHGVAR